MCWTDSGRRYLLSFRQTRGLVVREQLRARTTPAKCAEVLVRALAAESYPSESPRLPVLFRKFNRQKLRMSWLFGYGASPSTAAGAGGDTLPMKVDGVPQGDPAILGKKSQFQFDSTALERAAKAARELENSRESCFLFFVFFSFMNV